MVLCYLHNVKNSLQLHDLATGALLKTFPLEVGSVVGYSGQKKDTEIFYQFTSFLSPGESLSTNVVQFKNQTHVWVAFEKSKYNAVLAKITYAVLQPKALSGNKTVKQTLRAKGNTNA